ncbi:MAG: hypothetical protein J6P69_04515 [Bacteroidales bacterium]|nr:hypothetical protein [Bacteroidales bacterium]
MESNNSSSWWDRTLDFLEASAEILRFGAAIGAPIAAGIERRKIIKAQDESWKMRQEYRRNHPRPHSRRNGKKK